MKFVADLHLHSRYSRAVSQDMVLPKMAEWAKFKGINVLATGDFTHPFWFDQLKNELDEVGNGLYRLKTNDRRLTQEKALDVSHSALDKQETYFLLSCEISSIYSQGGKTRRVHNLFFFPSLSSVAKFNEKLLFQKANLRSDGRPIVGISSRDLARIALDVDEKALIIPAHAWTPWFSVFGSFSGFDSIEECFGDMAPYIYGIETGLSSDPAMNWQVGDLDKRAILSFSDAHSLDKMGREATVFEADEINYNSIYAAICGTKVTNEPKVPNAGKTSGSSGSSGSSVAFVTSPKVAFTIEFYPEEGKYHYTGHRDCGVSQSPAETAQNGSTCSVCSKQLTVGVMHRVEEIKTRNQLPETRNQKRVRWVYPKEGDRAPFVSMVPLLEIISEALESGIKTKKVTDQYRLLIDNLGSEFSVLLTAEIDEISKFAQPKVVEGIKRVRTGEINIEPGYDGKFGVVKIWDREKEESRDEARDQLNLFA